MPTLSSKNAQNSKKIAVFCIFFEKYLVMSKKSSTFALAFEKEVRHSKNGAVVQLVRIHACHAWGREFESRPHRREEAEMFLLFFAGLAEPSRASRTSTTSRTSANSPRVYYKGCNYLQPL